MRDFCCYRQALSRIGDLFMIANFLEQHPNQESPHSDTSRTGYNQQFGLELIAHGQLGGSHDANLTIETAASKPGKETAH